MKEEDEETKGGGPEVLWVGGWPPHIKPGKQHRAAVVMKQLTRVVNRERGGWWCVGAGGQQHLGQHGRTDTPQMSHSQLTHITEAKVGQNLLGRETLRTRERERELTQYRENH